MLASKHEFLLVSGSLMWLASRSLSHGLLSPMGMSSFKVSSLPYPSRHCSTMKETTLSDFSVLDDDDDEVGNSVDGDYGYNDVPNKKSVGYVPPEVSTTNADGNDYDINNHATRTSRRGLNIRRNEYDDFDDDYEQRGGQRSIPSSPRREKRKEPVGAKMAGTSWMQKNVRFSNDDNNSEGSFFDGRASSRRQSDGPQKRTIADTKTFREDFRKTRIFVQGIPPGVSWQDLKDHFRVAGNVVFASVSVDVNTGVPKGHGIVQFETTAMAQTAIGIMRDHPLNGATLFVREDVQESDNPNAQLRTVTPKGPTPPSKWKCANEDNASYISDEELAGIRSLIKARDDARRRKKYDVSDRIRDELKESHGVFIDDRLKMWWTVVDGSKVPQSIQDIKGDGRWTLKSWRMIPTTPENDACVSPDLVEGLLKQRDVARREKDFSTADALLERARTSPDGDLTLRIHDESRTFRVWTEERPPMERMERDYGDRQDRERSEKRSGERSDRFGERSDRTALPPSNSEEARTAAASECIAIVKEYAPEKTDEILKVLKQFTGREFQVLKRLKQEYL
jgi:hypothetical protein